MTSESAAASLPAEITVHDDPDQSRYEVLVDGVHAGGAYYETHGDRVVFTHTEVDKGWEGKGVGSALAKGALDDVRATGRQAIPVCPFIATYIRRHPEFLDLVDEHYREQVDPEAK